MTENCKKEIDCIERTICELLEINKLRDIIIRDKIYESKGDLAELLDRRKDTQEEIETLREKKTTLELTLKLLIAGEKKEERRGIIYKILKLREDKVRSIEQVRRGSNIDVADFKDKEIEELTEELSKLSRST